MPLQINLRHLEAGNLTLKGELPAKELDLDIHDDMVRVENPLEYEFEVQQLEQSLLLQGRLHVALECKCVRCLKAFVDEVTLDHWTRHLPLEGEEKTPVLNDFVDLTPYVREDILLEFPQHPLCEADCSGLLKTHPGARDNAGDPKQTKRESSAWDDLDKLKF